VAFKEWWASLEPSERRKFTSDKADSILKVSRGRAGGQAGGRALRGGGTFPRQQLGGAATRLLSNAPACLPRAPAHAARPSACRPGLQGLVKHFFNEKEVTSTLVMDALYAGCRCLEEAARTGAHQLPGCPRRAGQAAAPATRLLGLGSDSGHVMVD